MANVLDELVVLLNLDATKFKEGERDALDAFRRTRNEAEAFGRDISQQGMKLSEVFSTLKAGVIGLAAGFIGNDAVQFIHNVANADAATGRWAKTIGISTEGLSKWQYMVRQVGGDAASATSTLSALQQQIESVRQGSGMFDAGFASLMNQAGASISDDANTTLLKIRKFISEQVESGKMKPEEATTYLRRIPGMNQEMLTLLLQSTEAFNKLSKAVDNLGVASKQTAEAGAALQRSGSLLAEFWESVARRVLPTVGKIAEGINKIMESGHYGAPGSLVDRMARWMTGTKDETAGGPDTSDPMNAARAKLGEALRNISPQASGINASGGGTRGDRNNNPGNIKYGSFAREHGATGFDGPFAVFPDYATGSAAQEALVRARGYSGLTLHQFAARYAEGNASWEKTVGNSLGIGPNDIVNNQDPKLIEAIRRAEGTGSGARGAANIRYHTNSPVSNSSSSSEVHIGNITVNAPNATDADGVADGIGGAMKRQSLIAPINYGLA